MGGRNICRVTLWGLFSLPDKRSFEVLSAKDLITNFSEIGYFSIINAYEDYPIFAQ